MPYVIKRANIGEMAIPSTSVNMDRPVVTKPSAMIKAKRKPAFLCERAEANTNCRVRI